MSTKSAFAFESIQVGRKSQVLTQSIFAPNQGVATSAFITCENDIRYRYDGGEPSEFVGHILRDGNYIVLDGELNIRNFKCFSVQDHSTINATYERE